MAQGLFSLWADSSLGRAGLSDVVLGTVAVAT
jgi:hypothetical protein